MKNLAALPSFALLLAFLLGLAPGCATMQRTRGDQTGAVRSSQEFKAFNGEYHASDRLTAHPPRSIAVLPFDGDPADWDFAPEGVAPTDIVRRALYNHLAYLPFRDMELADVDGRLTRAGLLSAAEADLELDANLRRLRDILGVDAVVSGRVTHFDRMYVGLVSQVAVGCEVRMTDLTTGEVLWSARHVSRELGGGVAITPIGLALNALASAWNLRTVQLLRQTDDVFREIVATLAHSLPQTPALASAAQPPRIDLFAATPTGRVLRTGEAALLTVVGDAGVRAVVTLTRADGTAFREIELSPMPLQLRDRAVDAAVEAMGADLAPGNAAQVREYLSSREFYKGALPVPQGGEAYGLLAVARLERTDGAMAEAPLTSGRLDLDGLAPATPGGLRLVAGNRRIQAHWAATDHGFGTSYVIQAGPASGGPYPMEGTTGSTDFSFHGLDNFEELFFRVAAVDRAGNTSDFSSPMRAVPVPEPGIADLPSPGRALSGRVSRALLLRAEDGPLMVRGEVVVEPGGALHLGPGAQLRFGPDARLVVRGGVLAAHGEPRAPVLFIPAQKNGPPGAFQGIVLDAPQRALLRYAVIRNAATALKITHAAPMLHGVEVTGSSQAGMVLGPGARPVVTCSRFLRNQGMGAVVAEGQNLAPSLRDNLFSDNVPFDVQNFSGVELDLTGNAWGTVAPKTSPAPQRFLGSVNTGRPLSEFPPSCMENAQ